MLKASGPKAARGWAAAAIVFLIAGGPGRTQQSGVRVLEHFKCSGKVGTYSAGIADRSIGGGDNMCYFVSQSEVGRKILRACPIATNCEVVATVKNDSSGGDWSPIITHVISQERRKCRWSGCFHPKLFHSARILQSGRHDRYSGQPLYWSWRHSANARKYASSPARHCHLAVHGWCRSCLRDP